MSNEGSAILTGLTEEDMNALQGVVEELDNENKDGADANKDANADAKGDDSKAAEEAAKAAEDAKKADDAASKKDDKADDKKDESQSDIDIMRELREQNRVALAALEKLSAENAKLYKVMVDKGIITEDEIKESKAASEKEQELIDKRQSTLNEMIGVMEVSPQYSDVRTVCTQGNLDDLIDAFSRFYVSKNGGDVGQVAKAMEAEIWAEANPYKRMYDLIKRYHPKFASKDDGKKADDKKDEGKKDEGAKKEDDAKKIAEDADKSKKEKEAVDANPSAANMGAGGSGAGGGGWTAAKIDALPEDELPNVPKDIYDKYMQGLLK